MIGDDPVRHSKSVRYLLDELGCFGCCSGCHWLDFDPFCELVDSYEYVAVSANCRLQGSHRVESPTSEWPGGRYCP